MLHRIKFLLRTAAIGIFPSLLAAALVSAFVGLLTEWITIRKSPSSPPPIHVRMQSTLHALQKNSQEAAVLMRQFEVEAEQRQKALATLQQELTGLEAQRRLLELSPEQRKALEVLVTRPRTVSQTITSAEFWFRQVFVSAALGSFFFWLGLRVHRRRQEKGGAATRDPDRVP